MSSPDQLERRGSIRRPGAARRVSDQLLGRHALLHPAHSERGDDAWLSRQRGERQREHALVARPLPRLPRPLLRLALILRDGPLVLSRTPEAPSPRPPARGAVGRVFLPACHAPSHTIPAVADRADPEADRADPEADRADPEADRADPGRPRQTQADRKSRSIDNLPNSLLRRRLRRRRRRRRRRPNWLRRRRPWRLDWSRTASRRTSK